jgi:hypothetical protein
LAEVDAIRPNGQRDIDAIINNEWDIVPLTNLLCAKSNIKELFTIQH